MPAVTRDNYQELGLQVSPEDVWLLWTFRWYIVTTRDGNRYVACNNSKIKGYLHWFIVGKPIDKSYIDHIDGDGLNNRRENLRLVTNQFNQANSRKNKATKSKYKGVSFSKEKNLWRAYISPNRKMVHLGYFDTELEAAKAYNKAALTIWGHYANVNKLDERSIDPIIHGARHE